MEGGNIGLWDRDTRLARGWMGVEVGGIFFFSHLELKLKGRRGGKTAAPEGKTGAGKIVINGTMWVSLEGGGGAGGGERAASMSARSKGGGGGGGLWQRRHLESVQIKTGAGTKKSRRANTESDLAFAPRRHRRQRIGKKRKIVCCKHMSRSVASTRQSA